MLLIAGPTASGKSALALRLAEHHGGTVINADSMAVYRDLRILTGRPTPTEEARVPHRLYGHLDAAETYSVGRWLADVGAEIDGARRAGTLAVVAGGTGLYFKALTQGLSDIPAVPAETRERLRAETRHMTAESLHVRLAERDPAMAARVRPTDPQRILRALEIYEATGRSLAYFQGRRSPPLLQAGSYTAILVDPERAALRVAIDHRFDRMMEEGALEEVRALASRSLDAALPAMRALGVPPLLMHLLGALPLDDAVEQAKAQTRSYAKRQVTFARHQLSGFTRISRTDAFEVPGPG